MASVFSRRLDWSLDSAQMDPLLFQDAVVGMLTPTVSKWQMTRSGQSGVALAGPQ
jgi:hypothetical protein